MMYSKVLTFNSSLQEPGIIQVEAGLSGGIPQIQILGDVTGRYIRNSKKFYYVFTNSGRKLPNKKIRVLVTQNSEHHDEDGLDLTIFVSIYLAINNIQQKGDLYCLGNISLNGSVTPSKDIYKKIYNIEYHSSHLKQDIILTPPMEIPTGVSSKNKYLFIREVRDIYRYFEGNLEEVVIQPKIASKSNNVPWIGLQLAHSLKKPILSFINKGEGVELSSFEHYQMEENLLPKIFNSETKQIIPIDDMRSLRELHDISTNKSLQFPYFKITLEKFKDNRSWEILSDCLHRVPWILETQYCPCGANNSSDLLCTCSTSSFQQHQAIIKKVITTHKPIIFDPLKIRGCRDRFEELTLQNDPDIGKIYELSLLEQINELFPSLSKKRAIEFARLISF